MNPEAVVKAAIYSRKSKFTGKGESTENQIEMCKSYLKAKYGESLIYIYEDEGFSGKSTNRPEFKKMLQAARDKKINMIICYRLDRISRNIGDFAKLIEELESLNISFISLKEQFDTSSPMGRAMMYIASVFSQLERETIAERVKDNMDELAKTGRWLGGAVPTGYRSVKCVTEAGEGRSKQFYSLEAVDSELEVVKLIFELFLAEKTLSGTLKQLREKNIRTKNGKPFTAVTLKGILENPVYMKADCTAYDFFMRHKVNLFADKQAFNGINGVMAFNKTIQRSGKGHKKLDISQWIVSIGAHEAVVDGALWEEVFALLNNRQHLPKNNYALMSGILKCGVCGAYMVTKKRTGQNGFYYLCPSKVKGSCNLSRHLNGINADLSILRVLQHNLFCEDVMEQDFKEKSLSSKEINISLCELSTEAVFKEQYDVYNYRVVFKENVTSAIWDGENLTIKFRGIEI